MMKSIAFTGFILLLACQSNEGQLCQPNGAIISIPGTKTDFYACIDGQLKQFQCPEGYHLCQKGLYCSPDCEEDVIVDSPDYCSNARNGVTHKQVNSCSGYVICENQSAKFYRCQGNREFDGIKGACSNRVCK